jgi:hypothetical protein
MFIAVECLVILFTYFFPLKSMKMFYNHVTYDALHQLTVEEFVSLDDEKWNDLGKMDNHGFMSFY